MKQITPKMIRSWRLKNGLTQVALGELLGLKKIALTKIESGQRAISEPEQKLFRMLMFGELPFASIELEKKSSDLYFTPHEWDIVQMMARKNGYTDAKMWVVDRIRGYLRMNPESAEAQMAAEPPADYND